MMKQTGVGVSALFAVVSAMAFGGAVCSGAPAPRRFPLGATEVAPRVMTAMASRNVAVDGAEVTMLAKVVATSAHPALEVTSLTRWNDLRNKAEIACASRTQCLPFYVFVTWPDKDSAAKAVAAFSDDPSGSAKSRDGARIENGAAPGEGPLESRSATAAVTLRAGAHALLAIDEDGIHIRVPVTCLENGAPGKRIRVLGPDRRQVYFAEVLEDNSLRGTL